MKRKFTFLIAAAVMLLTMMATTGRMWGETVKYTLSSSSTTTLTTTGTAPNGSSASIAQTYSTSCQMTSGNSQTLTLTNYYGYSITNITLSMKSNSKGGAGKLSYSTDGGATFTYIVGSSTGDVAFNQAAWNGAWSTSYVDISKDVTIVPESGKNLIIKIEATANSLYCQSYQFTYTSGTTCATPTFTPAAGTVLSGTTVAISTTTADATIYYTMGANPDDPTTSSAVYSTPIEITEATTIKAIAVKDGYNNSTIASAAYTIITPLTTMQQIFDAATSTETQVAVTFNQWVITGNTSYQAYLTDGTKGCMIYGSGHGFTAGNVLSGTVICKLVLYYGQAELKQLTTTTPGISIETGGSVTPVVSTIDQLSAVNTGSVVTIKNLTYNGSTLSDGQHTIIPYNGVGYTPSFVNGKTYNVTGVFGYGYGTTDDYKRIYPRSASDIVEATDPEISINPATAEPFTYVLGSGPSTEQLFEITGENLTSDDIIATITTGAEYFEITDNQEYSSTVTVNSGNYISIRLKADLELGNEYAGVLTLTNDGAQDITMNLSGSVTGSTYTIEQYSLPATAHGTITFDPASPVEVGTEVTLTATPYAGYDFVADSWKFYDATTLDEVSLTVTDGNKITMPAYNLAVDATFNEKQTYAITKVVTPENSGTITTDATAWEGKEVTVSVQAANGYTFSSIVISKTGEPETSIPTSGNANDGFTFTMPGYAVTATATFISNIFEGSFVKVTTLNDLEDDGCYVLVFNSKAMNSTLTSGRMGAVELTITNNTITNPNRSIVWKLKENDDNWDLYSEKEGKYCYINGNSTSSFAMGDDAEYSFVVTGYNDGGFKFLTTHDSGRGIYQIATQYASYAASNNPEVYLYKYMVLTERTITFNGNGGLYQGDETYTQTVYDGIATTLTANQFEKDNSIFAGWALTTDGDVEYADQAEVTINSDLTLYAKWNIAYTATVANNITGGTVKIDDGSAQGVSSISVSAGTEITLTQTPDLGYVFNEWNVYKTGNPEINVPVTNNKFEMPAYNVTISATYNEAETYSLVTSVNQIVSGKHYIIASGTEGNNVKAMGQQYTNNRAAVSVSINGTTISKTEGVYEFVINGPDANDNYIIYDVTNKGYLYAASSSNNYLRNQSTNDANGIWSFSINGDTHAATVIAQGDNTNKYMRFNNSIFSCYGSGSSIQNPVYFYMKDNDNNYEYYSCDITYEQTSIPDGETITIGEGSVMTVPNNFENTDPTALVIEDGGQLIHANAVEATIQKGISAHSAQSKSGDGWYLIASPADGVSTSGLITDPETSYDLYKYDEPSGWWYSNHGEASPFTTLERGKGYLYANANDMALDFAGSMIGTDDEVTKTLSFACTAFPELKGYNLMGNPFTRNLGTGDITLGGEAVTSVLLLDNDSEYQTCNFSESGVIKPGQGFFIQATAENQQLVFNPSEKDVNEIGLISIKAGDENYIDKAYIQFDGGNTLRKMTLTGEKSQVYVMNGDEDYAAARLDEAKGVVPVHFEAAAEGTYTITIEAKNLDLETLRLIDNFSGEEIDLLVEPSYTFKANSDDPAARFTLMFEKSTLGIDENDVENEVFAYQNGSDIIINGNGTLQVFDMMGRFVMSKEINGSKTISTSAFNAGVYILRIVGENMMTQKIVVK